MSTYNLLGSTSNESFLTNVSLNDRQKLAAAWNDTVLHQKPALPLF
ncbi:MAG: hypothetical protein QNJ54_16840 [Prochloraceae cyanobacterium]|nr:hypothetical protein [Prochloraceae cyanobacterium]